MPPTHFHVLFWKNGDCEVDGDAVGQNGLQQNELPRNGIEGVAAKWDGMQWFLKDAK